jgi:IclR family acetate operon transcriptional repressor
MLAFSGRELPEGPLRAYTPRTITDPRALAEEIARVREQGWAKAIGEREPDLTAIAAPIRSARGELEAIVALQGPSSRFDDAEVERALPVLLAHADAISRELGWRPPGKDER